MSEEVYELLAFSGISDETMSKIVALMDETIVKDQLGTKKIDSLIQLGFPREKAHDIITTFFNFYAGLEFPDQVNAIIDNSSLIQKEKDLLKKSYETIKKRADKNYLDILRETKEIREFGHPHLHTLDMQTEFRPIIKNGKIVKMIPSIIVSGSAYDHSQEQGSAINFQVTPEVLESILQELNEGLEKVKKEISALKNQLGDNIVD